MKKNELIVNPQITLFILFCLVMQLNQINSAYFRMSFRLKKFSRV